MKIVEKDWGREYWLEVNDNYVMKKIVINGGESLPNHYHNKKHETFHIIEGHGTAILNGVIQKIAPGDTLIIPASMRHSIVTFGLIPITFIEASTPQIADSTREPIMT